MNEPIDQSLVGFYYRIFLSIFLIGSSCAAADHATINNSHFNAQPQPFQHKTMYVVKLDCRVRPVCIQEFNKTKHKQNEINIELVIKTINQNSHLSIAFRCGCSSCFFCVLHRNSNEWCSAHFSSAFNQKRCESIHKPKLHFAFTIQINGFHLKLKYFSRCFLLFASWHSLFSEMKICSDSESMRLVFFLFLVLMAREYKCWYHSIWFWLVV